MSGNILMTGANGFIGRYLTRYFTQRGYTIHILSRNPEKDTPHVKSYHWDPKTGKADISRLKDVQYIFHLAGANIGEKRWTAKRKKEILQSRLDSTQLLYKILKEGEIKPECIFCSSAIGYYGVKDNGEIKDEESPSGNDFLAGVCREWERAHSTFDIQMRIRTVILRKGVVLGQGGGLFQKTGNLCKWRINTAPGSGKQPFHWIHIKDLCRLYEHFMIHQGLRGIYNAISPETVSMDTFTKQINKSFGQKVVWPKIPSRVLQWILGDMSEILLNGPVISVHKLLDTGFTFNYPDIKTALSNLHKS